MLPRFARPVALALLVSLGSSAAASACSVKLEQVYFRQGSFAGATGIRMKYHASGNPLPVPEWLDFNLDGDTDDALDRNEPGGFVRSTNFKVKAKFDVSGVDPTTVHVWAEGGLFGGLDSAPSPVTLDAAGAGIFQINTPVGTIEFYEKETWNWTWKYKMGDDPTVYTAGTSTHTICITANASVGQPVYKWVMIPSCKSCDGLNPTGENWDKQIADRLFQNFEANAKVDGTELKYHIDYGEAGSKTQFLLVNKKAACGHWANYFNHQAEAQGVGTLKVRGFELLHGAPTNFDDEEKWKGLMTYAGGVNNARAQTNMTGTRMVIAGRYAQSSTKPGATDWADSWVEGDPHWAWGMVNHGVVMLQKGTTSYLYDTSFEIGPVAFPGFNIPAHLTVASYAPNHVFRTQYIDNIAQPFAFIWGKIMFSRPLWFDGLYDCYVRVGDESLSPGLPTTVKIGWWDAEAPE